MEEASNRILEHIRGQYYGKFRGIVTDNADPTNRGRIKVKVHDVFGEEIEKWADPCLPHTGKGVGSYWIPEKDAGVWIEFEAGDKSLPVWTGGYWADNELPEDEKSNAATPSLRIMRSASGLMVTMNDDAEAIAISDKDGSNIITIEVQEGGGKIRIAGNAKVVVEAPSIELVEGSTQPVVLGDGLFNYLTELVTTLQAHVHAGELAASVIPVTPAPASTVFRAPTKAEILSQKVTTG